MNACDACLRRGELLGILGPRIESLGRPGAERTRLLLALGEDELIQAVAPDAVEAIGAELTRFNASAMRGRAQRAGLAVVCRHDDDYPDRLEVLADAPNPLFLHGDLEAMRELATTPAVAIVGGRSASQYALEVAHELGRGLAVTGVPVISGLALGVDAAAHRGVLAGEGRAIVVLASGADVPYPRRHRPLYRALSQRGVVISEVPPGTTARRWAFPARNRIMAALATMVVVVEAAESSGSLITATFAADIGRELGAVPGRVNAAAAAGSNKLLGDGIAPVLGVEDVLDRIFHPGARAAPPPLRIELDAPTRAVLAAVEAGEPPTALRQLAAKEVRVALGRLESAGLVRRDGLGGYERTGIRYEAA